MWPHSRACYNEQLTRHEPHGLPRKYRAAATFIWQKAPFAKPFCEDKSVQLDLPDEGLKLKARWVPFYRFLFVSGVEGGLSLRIACLLLFRLNRSDGINLLTYLIWKKKKCNCASCKQTTAIGHSYLQRDFKCLRFTCHHAVVLRYVCGMKLWDKNIL